MKWIVFLYIISLSADAYCQAATEAKAATVKGKASVKVSSTKAITLPPTQLLSAPEAAVKKAAKVKKSADEVDYMLKDSAKQLQRLLIMTSSKRVNFSIKKEPKK